MRICLSIRTLDVFLQITTFLEDSIIGPYLLTSDDLCRNRTSDAY